MKIDRLSPLQLFVAAAEAGSFSAAARRLDLGPVQASATIARLERELGARLFERSTRRLRLTDAGEQWLPHARQLLATWEDGQVALREAAGVEQPLSGRLRVSLPSDVGRQHLWRWIEDFIAAEAGPRLALELRLSDRLADLVQDPVDYAVRYGEPPDSSLIALPLAPDNRRVLCASPAYIARHGQPRSPTELKAHDCVRWGLGESVHGRWRFTYPRAKRSPSKWAAVASPMTAAWCANGRWRGWVWPTKAGSTSRPTWPPGGSWRCCRTGSANPHPCTGWRSAGTA